MWCVIRLSIAASYFYQCYTFWSIIYLSAGLHKVYWHLVGRMYPRRDVIQPSTVPGQALPGPAQPHSGYSRFPMSRRPGLHHQWEGMIKGWGAMKWMIDVEFNYLLLSLGEFWLTEYLVLFINKCHGQLWNAKINSIDKYCGCVCENHSFLILFVLICMHGSISFHWAVAVAV